MGFIVILLCGILGRVDGWGKGDSFLPIWPFTKDSWKIGGINYTRYAIGLLLGSYTHNMWLPVTYAVAVSIPYGEKHWWMRYGLISWIGIGLLYGAASLTFIGLLFSALVIGLLKHAKVNQAWLEFIFYMSCLPAILR